MEFGVSSFIDLNGGVIRNFAERDAGLNFTPLDTTGVFLINCTEPTVTQLN